MALPIVLISLGLGNLGGIVVTAVMGLSSMDYTKPGGVVLSLFQAGFGAILAFHGCEWLLKNHRLANFWILIVVLLVAISAVLTVGLTLLMGHFELLDWKLASGISAGATMEFVRRMIKSEGLKI